MPITVLPAGTENLFRPPLRPEARPARPGRDRSPRAGSSRVDLGPTAGRRFTADGGLRLRRRRRHPPPPRPGRRAGARPADPSRSPTSSRSSAPASRTASRPITVRSPTRAPRRPCAARPSSSSTCPATPWDSRSPPSARGDDGWLDLVVFRNAGPFRALLLPLDGRPRHPPRRSRRLPPPGPPGRRHRRETVPVQLDGDPGGYVRHRGVTGRRRRPWTIEVDSRDRHLPMDRGAPARLKMLVPPRRGRISALGSSPTAVLIGSPGIEDGTWPGGPIRTRRSRWARPIPWRSARSRIGRGRPAGPDLPALA